MERKTVSELKEHFQKIVRIAENDPELIILDAEETDGSKIGDNYLSVVLRLRITGKKGNGESYSGRFMTKYYPRHRKIAALIRNSEVFLNEAHVYNNILPMFNDIAPRCIFANQDEIVMKDLKFDGYVVQPRRELLDFDHCCAVVQTLAKLHAQSLVLKLKEPEKFGELMSSLIETIFPQDESPCMGTSLDTSISLGIDHLKSLDNDDTDIVSLIPILEDLRGKAFEILKKIVLPNQGKYDVMTHGDSWNNNLLFKHDNDGNVIDCKLIDFQISRHVSLAIDLHYFIYSSAKSCVIEDNYDELIDHYYKNLIKNLRQLKIAMGHLKEISFDWLTGELNKCHYYGLFTSFWLVNAVLADEDETINMDDLTEDFLDDLKQLAPSIKRVKAERIKCVVLHWFKKYYGK